MRIGRASALPALLLLAACGDAEHAKPPKQALKPEALPQGASTARPASGASRAFAGDVAPKPGKASASGDAQAAATALETYYTLIEAGEYAKAWDLRERSPKAPDAETFARNFERYREHHASVGTPSEPVAASGSLFVEIPVHTYGTMKDGRSFGSAGTVTLRRRRTGSDGGKWRILTSG